jgi:hypothetical protein
MTLSGVLLVTCKGKTCDNIVKKAKKLNGVKYAFRVNRLQPEDADVIVNVNANSETEIFSVRNELSRDQGVDNIKVKMGSEQI